MEDDVLWADKSDSYEECNNMYDDMIMMTHE